MRKHVVDCFCTFLAGHVKRSDEAVHGALDFLDKGVVGFLQFAYLIFLILTPLSKCFVSAGIGVLKLLYCLGVDIK